MTMTNVSTEAADIRSALKSALAQLRAAGVPSHTLAAELLLMKVVDRDRAWIYAHPEETLTPEQQARFMELVARRCTGEPTQYLTGRQEFWGRDFEVGPGVLIPRPETEHVVEVALEMLGPPAKEGPEMFRIADVGTGSGCLAITLALALPRAQVVATDISEAALDYARRNAQKHGVAHRIHFVQDDFLRGWIAENREPLDLAVSNPPYIGRKEAASLPREVHDHEPHEALFGGDEGFEVYETLIAQARNALRPSGVLVLELGYNALSRVRSLLETQAWSAIGVTRDLAGIARVIAARRGL